MKQIYTEVGILECIDAPSKFLTYNIMLQKKLSPVERGPINLNLTLNRR